MANHRGPNYRACERCGKGCQGRGVRCPTCTKHCRRCDAGGLPNRVMFCEPCGELCPLCDKPHGIPRRTRAWCSPCTYEHKRAVDEKAKDALGRRCSRCWITHPLQWDHINDDPVRRGSAKKRASVLMSEYSEIVSIVETGQSLRLQLHCPNCNWLKQFDPEAYAQPPTYGALPVQSRFKVGTLPAL